MTASALCAKCIILAPASMQYSRTTTRNGYGMLRHGSPHPPLLGRSLQSNAKGRSVPMICRGGPLNSGQRPPMPRKIGSVGLAAGSGIAIISNDSNFLGADEIGEIVIHGGTVMIGYEPGPRANRKARPCA